MKYYSAIINCDTAQAFGPNGYFATFPLPISFWPSCGGFWMNFENVDG